MSKTTMVSFAPIDFDEFVPFLFPPTYKIAASDGKIPSVLVIDDSFYFIENWVGDDVTKFPVTKSSIDVANSLIKDFKDSLLFVDADAYPAVFAVEGAYTPEEILIMFKSACESNLQAQQNWLWRFINDADDLWQRFRQHKMISDLHRKAATFFGLVDRDWLSIPKNIMKCPACYNSVDPNQAICGACRCIINHDTYAKMQFAEVK